MPADKPDGGKTSGIRNEVIAFAALMERELRANDHKPGWKNDYATALLQRLREETEELAAALRTHDKQHVAKEAADVANFAMMIADIRGGLLDG